MAGAEEEEEEQLRQELPREGVSAGRERRRRLSEARVASPTPLPSALPSTSTSRAMEQEAAGEEEAGRSAVEEEELARERAAGGHRRRRGRGGVGGAGLLESFSSEAVGDL